jgi:hypothetical protein
MSEIDNRQIFEVLMKQNTELATIKEKVSSIEIQTIKTNGRVTLLEGKSILIDKEESSRNTILNTTNITNKRWISSIGIILMGGWTIIVLIIDHYLNKFFK